MGMRVQIGIDWMKALSQTLGIAAQVSDATHRPLIISF